MNVFVWGFGFGLEFEFELGLTCPLVIGYNNKTHGYPCVLSKWCWRRDLNPHAFRHTPLKRTCLPFHHSS